MCDIQRSIEEVQRLKPRRRDSMLPLSHLAVWLSSAENISSHEERASSAGADRP
jgi:hypothetical protein